MPRHSIQVVSSRTGLSPDVIRAWERRYHAVAPARSTSRRRLYSDEDVERLSLLRRATLAGRRIGEIAAFDLDRLKRLVREDAEAMARVEPPPSVRGASARRHLDGCLEAALALDASTLDHRLHRASLDLDLETLFDGVLTPLLNQIGDQWMCGRLSIAHEHVATALVRSLLDSLRATFGAASAQGTLLSTTPTGQHHELGAMKVAVLAAAEGWNAVYPGPDLPAEEIARAAHELDAAVVALSVVYRDKDPQLEQELERLGRALPRGTSLVVGGGAARHYHAVLTRIGAALPGDMKSMRAMLARLRAEHGTPPASGG